MDSAYYLRINRGLEAIRIGTDTISVQENDFNHGDWCLDTSELGNEVVDRVHNFCVREGISLPSWSAMAYRRY
jgi:hypothetical protein